MEEAPEGNPLANLESAAPEELREAGINLEGRAELIENLLTDPSENLTEREAQHLEQHLNSLRAYNEEDSERKAA